MAQCHSYSNISAQFLNLNLTIDYTHFWSSLRQACNTAEVVRDGNVHASGQIPRFADPRVVQATIQHSQQFFLSY
jgi:hypothetical protein